MKFKKLKLSVVVALAVSMWVLAASGVENRVDVKYVMSFLRQAEELP